MANIPTPHINAKIGDFANTVLMPGDPLRTKYIAENYLKNVKLINEIRGALGYTGTYKGKKISLMTSGMGMPSMGIYAYELYNFYNVDNIIRIGSAGGISNTLKMRDVVFAIGASTDSNFISQFKLNGNLSLTCDFDLLKKCVQSAENLNINYKIGNILTSDVFYADSQTLERWRDAGICAVEMEAAALYATALKYNKKALCICTISDLPFKGLELSAKQRAESFDDMIKVALEAKI